MTHLGEEYPCLRYRASFELVSIVIGVTIMRSLLQMKTMVIFKEYESEIVGIPCGYYCLFIRACGLSATGVTVYCID
jgi:hypothetical protein